MFPILLHPPPAFGQDVAQDLTNTAVQSATLLAGGLVLAVIVGYGLMYMARRSGARAQEELEAASRPLEERSPALIAQLARPKRDVDMAALVDRVPRFSLDRFREWAHALYKKVHHARVTRDTAELADLVGPGALEMAFHGPPGLEAIGRIRFVRTRLVKTTVATTGCQVRLNVVALVDETRSGERRTWEIDETWVFSRDGNSWKVLRIDRDNRIPFARPTPTWDKPFIEDLETRRDPQVKAQQAAFEESHPDLDWARFEEGARQAFARVQAAVTHQQPEAVSNLLSPLALEELQTWMRRYHKHGLARKRLDPEVARIEVVRCTTDAEHERVSCRVVGTIVDLVEDGEGRLVGEQRTDPTRFSSYWTFFRKSGGAWRVDTIDDDTTWVV